MPGDSFEALRRFFETSAAGRKATRPLASAAEVGLELSGGPARFAIQSGAPQVTDEPARDPDFVLQIPDEAVRRITGLGGEDVGAFGIEFFQLVLSRDPALRVRLRIVAPTTRLVTHGYLGVLALGGARVAWWLLKNGVKNPKAAIDRFRGR